MNQGAFFPDAWGAQDWLLPVGLLLAVGLVVLIWAYARCRTSGGIKTSLLVMKIAALGLLGICLLEPMQRTQRPEKGANLMVVMADDSQSLQIKDQGQSETRAAVLKQRLNEESKWLASLAEDFDVRRYQFDRRLRPVSNFTDFRADQSGSDVLGNLKLVTQRFAQRPTAGVLLLTDGIGNNVETGPASLDSIDWENAPPIYPIVVGKTRPAKDLGITQIISTQTNFESAPVTVTAELLAHGYQGRSVVVQLLDESGAEVDRKEVGEVEDGKPFAVRFKTRPARRGVNVYSVNTFAQGEELPANPIGTSAEATIVNNQATTIVDRGNGPFRVLYVSGRPNWELKFLRRSIEEEEEIDLVALVRIAKREAKFSFRGNAGQQSNSLYKGFQSEDDDTAEQHDEAVFIRLGTRDENELLGGFPKDAESLYKYDAIVLDDVESSFFTEDQKSLIQQFVSLRGGGLLMLGGQESFGSGDYDRTQIGEILPVYLDGETAKDSGAQFQLNLTREGWLQPWVRIKATESEEKKRLASMPKFKTLNRSRSIKPGATVLASVHSDGDQQFPALVVQPYGKGRTSALMIGDLWRWHLKSETENEDLQKAWRQTLRWLVSDVPRRVEVEVIKKDDANQSAEIKIRVRDENFKPFDNASISVEVATPDGKSIELTAEPSDSEPGLYVANFVSSASGAYRATVTASSDDGSEIEQRESGWVSAPSNEEFKSLVPNREFLESIASRSGGEVLELGNLEDFVSSLDHREVPVVETRSLPWWHRWPVFTLAIGLLVGEWGVRRWKGLP